MQGFPLSNVLGISIDLARSPKIRWRVGKVHQDSLATDHHHPVTLEVKGQVLDGFLEVLSRKDDEGQDIVLTWSPESTVLIRT